MSTDKNLPERLRYFMHDVDGRSYGGWFRRPTATHVEVIAQGHVRLARLGAASAERTAALLLEEIVRTSASSKRAQS
jgi:hypothetical protein